MNPSGMTSSSYSQGLYPKAKNLKLSCDFCALSKVKCDRGWPHCLRCIRNEVECHYSETRRTSKAREQCATPGRIERSINNNASSKDQSKHQSESRSGDNTPPNVSGTQTPNGELLLSSDSVISMDIFNQQISGLPDYSTSNPHAGLPLDLTFLHQESLDDFPHMSSSQLDFDGQSMQLMKEIGMQCAPLDFASTLDKHSESYSQGQQSSIDHETGCMKRAFATLEDLQLPTPHCSRQTYDSPSQITIVRGFDSTLRANRRAIDTALQILSCSCSRSYTIFLLLILIAQKVMDSYWNMSKKLLDIPLSPTSGVSFGNDSYWNDQEATWSGFDVPMAVGEYFLSQATRKKVLGQVLRSEIEEMERLIDILVSRHIEINYLRVLCKAFIESLQACQKQALQSLIVTNRG